MYVACVLWLAFYTPEEGTIRTVACALLMIGLAACAGQGGEEAAEAAGDTPSMSATDTTMARDTSQPCDTCMVRHTVLPCDTCPPPRDSTP
jgi:hypothetical protein